MNTLTSIINKIFKHRKDVPMDQEQNFPELENQPVKSGIQPGLKDQKERRKTIEDAPAPGEESAP